MNVFCIGLEIFAIYTQQIRVIIVDSCLHWIYYVGAALEVRVFFSPQINDVIYLKTVKPVDCMTVANLIRLYCFVLQCPTLFQYKANDIECF